MGTKDGKGNQRQCANIRMRYGRTPMIGDKFASRHGQKGVLSIQWPDVNMPYSAATGGGAGVGGGGAALRGGGGGGRAIALTADIYIPG